MAVVVGEIPAVEEQTVSLGGQQRAVVAVHSRVLDPDPAVAVHSDPDSVKIVPRGIRRGTAKCGAGGEAHGDAVGDYVNHSVVVRIAQDLVLRDDEHTGTVQTKIVLGQGDDRQDIGALDCEDQQEEGKQEDSRCRMGVWGRGFRGMGSNRDGGFGNRTRTSNFERRTSNVGALGEAVRTRG